MPSESPSRFPLLHICSSDRGGKPTPMARGYRTNKPLATTKQEHVSRGVCSWTFHYATNSGWARQDFRLPPGCSWCLFNRFVCLFVFPRRHLFSDSYLSPRVHGWALYTVETDSFISHRVESPDNSVCFVWFYYDDFGHNMQPVKVGIFAAS